jgi:hypothetical protein
MMARTHVSTLFAFGTIRLDNGMTEEESGDMSTHTYRDMSFGAPGSRVSLDDFISDVKISLGGDIGRDLEDDARELSEIDGVPVPPKYVLNGSSFSSSITWDPEPTTSWLTSSSLSAKTTVRIPAGTKFVLDPDTGEYTNVDDIVVEL